MKVYRASNSRLDLLFERNPYYRGRPREGLWILDVPVSEFFDISMGTYDYGDVITDIIYNIVPDMDDELNIRQATEAFVTRLNRYVSVYMKVENRHHLLNSKQNTNQGIWIQISPGTLEDENGVDRPYFNLEARGYWNQKPPVYTQNNAGEVTKYVADAVFDKSTGRLEYYRDLEQDRHYVRCKICSMFDLYRTNMVPVYTQQSQWTGRKNICRKCVVDYAMNEDCSVGFDGNKQLTISTQGTFRHLEVYSRDELTSLSGDYGRAFRYMYEYIDDDPTAESDWIDIYKVETVEIPTWSYNFDTTMHSWNWRFPIFLTSVKGDEGDDPRYVSASIGYDWQKPSWYSSTGPYFGAEFECFVRNDRTDMRRNSEVKKTAVKMFHPLTYPSTYVQDAEHQLLYAKEDGSLNEGDGIEFVSQPLSYQYWMNEVPERFWEYFRNNFRARNSSQCGIHVHLGWASMDIVHRYIFLYFLNRLNLDNSQLLQRVAGRGSTYYSVWNSLVYQGSRDQVFQVALMKTQTGANEKYNSINTRHSDTIELRYFQGNTGENSIKGIFQFINGLYRISDRLADPFREWDYLEEEQPTGLINILEDIKSDSDSAVLKHMMVDTDTLSEDDIKYFVNRVGAEYISDYLSTKGFAAFADRYQLVPSL